MIGVLTYLDVGGYKDPNHIAKEVLYVINASQKIKKSMGCDLHGFYNKYNGIIILLTLSKGDETNSSTLYSTEI